ncbi:MAG: dihydrolipoamide acetyltransferase family protein [Solirubrobacteraceae bacterium]
MSSSRTEVLIDVTMPQMGVSVAEGTVVAWRVQAGERIEAEQTICEISTDKIDTEIPAPISGVLAEILAAPETTVAVGGVLARIAPDAEGVAAVVTDGAAAEVTLPAPPTDGAAAEMTRVATPASRHRYSPVVQRIAAEHGVDLDTVPGTGRGGRVRKQDLLALVSMAPVTSPRVDGERVPEPGPPGGPSTDGQLSRIRRQIGERMKHSLHTAAHCTSWIEVDMGRVEAARALAGLTALPFVAAASVAALREHPALNAWLEGEQGEQYTRHGEVSLGIAVSLDQDGLVVPVIHQAHELSVQGLGARIKDLARRARARELIPEEVSGATFTITNPGGYGTIMATPIINQPQVAILDFEAVVKRPVVITSRDGEDLIAIRPVTILGLSWDHRALDGAQAAQFLAAVKRHLEEWPGA